MFEQERGKHPDLDRLVDLDEGLPDGGLPADEIERIRNHLHGCPSCRLELKRLRQFNHDDQDPDAVADADWGRAELALQRAFEEKVRPVIQAEQSGGSGRRWWVGVGSVAAAAVLAVLVLNFGGEPFRDSGRLDEGPIRGGESAKSMIILEEPAEDMDHPPLEFVWCSEREFDSYILEVFSPDLEPVFRMTDLLETRVDIPDSLLLLLHPGETYLWSVQGRSGLADADLSLTAWFRIVKPAIGKM